jgi:SAM-dependent methyltransferase
VQCTSCGLLYTNPLETGRYYQQLTARHAFAEMLTQASSRMPVYLAGLEIVNLLNRDRCPWRLLDVGCGTGTFVALATGFGYAAEGLEASDAQAELAQSLGIRVRHGACLENYADEAFEVVTMWDSLEHIPTPLQMLKQIRRVLAARGYLVVKVPNGPHYLWKTRLLGWMRPRKFNDLGFGEHVLHFSASSLRRIFTMAGFETLAIRTGAIESFRTVPKRIKRAGLVGLSLLGNLMHYPLGPNLVGIARRRDSSAPGHW